LIIQAIITGVSYKNNPFLDVAIGSVLRSSYALMVALLLRSRSITVYKRGEVKRLMNILYWVLFGVIAGSIANFIDPKPSQGGILGSIVLGIVGALIGGWLGSMLLGVTVTGFNLSSFLVAIAGSLLLLFIGRAFRRA
jgi:uncharacterized membrane protein YeaQ/YmgE (transglycosylase-associated protein family)